MSLKTAILALAIIGAIVAVAIAVRLAGLYIGAATSDWNPFKYHPYTLGNFELRGDVAIIETPVDIYVVVNGGQRILGPGRRFEIRLNGTTLIELWHTSGEVYRYLVYRDSDRYRAILHTCSCNKR